MLIILKLAVGIEGNIWSLISFHNYYLKRAGAENSISHLKHELCLSRCFLKGQIGDQINVSLSPVANNLRKRTRLRIELIFYLICKSLNYMFYRNFSYYPV